jgi:predicted transposase YbfD/YdcC
MGQGIKESLSSVRRGEVNPLKHPKGFSMSITTLSITLNLPNKALLFDLDALYEQLRQVKDQRHARGVRYPLAELLLIAVLAKLAGQTSSRAIAEWAGLRREDLQRLFALRRATMPHYSTWSRILGRAVDPEELERVLGQFFGRDLAQVAQPGQRHLCLDGKTLKGTIPLGSSQGVHLVAAYLPREGVVLAQVHVQSVGNEVSAAPVLLAPLDLRGTVVSGDASFASRKLSSMILQAKGDYLWVIKENQSQMYQDIQALFEPQPSHPGWSPPPMDFRIATSVDKGHGRLDKRRITVSSLLASYSLWPGLSQVFQLERARTNALGETEHQTVYGITSLPTSVGAARLLALVREHWGIENGLHYRRDRSLREDDSQLRMGHAPHLLAILNNTALGLFARQGESNMPQAQRTFAYQFDRALARLAA